MQTALDDYFAGFEQLASRRIVKGPGQHQLRGDGE
jgi:hypothetical protein